MKLKKWLSRGLVLAMVLALMVPVPAAAKSNGGGKLIKSVTSYELNSDETKWVPASKTTFTYDKKNNPKEIKTLWYSNVIFDAIPMSGSTTTNTFKYKYKGKTPKSLKVTNDAGAVVETRQYKKGNVVKVNSDYVDIEKNEAGAWVDNSSHYLDAFAYNKNGLVTVSSGVYNSTENSAPAGTSENNYTYFINQKAGIPSYIFRATAAGKYTAADGTVTPIEPSKSGYYETYNGKGLVVQGGWYDAETNKYDASFTVQYVMKKGKVAEAIVFSIVDGKEKPSAKYAFTYNKTSVSKARYMKMMNGVFGLDAGNNLSNMPFSWY